MMIKDIYEKETIILIPSKWLFYENDGVEEYLSCAMGAKGSKHILLKDVYGICECNDHTIIGFYNNNKPSVAWFPSPKMKRDCCSIGRYEQVIKFLEEKLKTKLRFDEKQFRKELWRL